MEISWLFDIKTETFWLEYQSVDFSLPKTENVDQKLDH